MNKMALLIPVFLLLVFSEWWFVGKKRGVRFNGKNVAHNMVIGAIDQFVSIANFALFFWVLKLVYDNFRLFSLGNEWYVWVLAYFAVDLVSYWYHRLSHRIAILWCAHVTHHSSEDYNFSNGFRTSPFQGLNRIPFWIILPIIGFTPTMLFAVFIVSGIYDFLLHTEHFPRMPKLEYVLITPSLHRVHHGKNEIYIDKNYGSTFSFWDRMFGTFQEETEAVHYGILSKEYIEGNPVDAIFHQYLYLWKLICRTQIWKNRLRVLILPPNYIPEDITLETKLSPPQKPIQKSIFIYALSLFIFSSSVVLLLLLYQDILSIYHLIYLALFAMSGMVVSVKIFYARARIHIVRNEILRWFIFLMVGLVLLLVMDNEKTFRL